MEPVTCSSCGQFVEDAAARVCPACGTEMNPGQAAAGQIPAGPSSGGPGGPTGAAAPPRNSVPFEDRSLPFLQRLFRTIGMAFSQPMQLFSAMAREDLGPPVVYGVLIGTVTAIITILWYMMFGGLAMLAEGVEPGEFAISTGLYVLILFLSPLLILIGLFISSAIYHVSLLLLGAGQRGFAVTFRAVTYGSTPTILGIVPFCGGIIGGLWAMVLTMMAFKLGHGTDWWRAILAYFLLAILCCCLVVWMAMSFGLLGALAN